MDSALDALEPKFKILEGMYVDTPVTTAQFVRLCHLLQSSRRQKFNGESYLLESFWSDVRFSSMRVKAESFKNLYNAHICWFTDEMVEGNGRRIFTDNVTDVVPDKLYDETLSLYMEGSITYEHALAQLVA